MDKPRLFISYSHSDFEWTRSFAEALKHRGVSVWFDQTDLEVGESLREGVEAALRSSDVLVAVLGASDSTKPALFFDLGAAIGMHKKVVPIVPKELDPQALPFDLGLRKYLVRESPEKTAADLAESLAAA